jgi:hypothetical protein
MTLVMEVAETNRADLSVQVVDTRGVADLLVCRSEAAFMAQKNEGIWCTVPAYRHGIRTVHFTRDAGAAQLRVCFVDQPSLAGWIRNHPLKGRLT